MEACNICKIKGIKKEKYPELYEAVESVCKKFDMNSIRVLIWPWGFSVGATYMDLLIVTKNFLKAMDKDELETIVAHEVSHMFNHHLLIRHVALTIFYAPLIGISAKGDFNSPLSLLLILVAFIWLLVGLRCVIWMSASLETNADIQAIYKTQKPEAFKRALLKLKFKSMRTDKRPSKTSKISECLEWVIGYFFGFTHPLTHERIEVIEQYEKNMKLVSRSNKPIN